MFILFFLKCVAYTLGLRLNADLKLDLRSEMDTYAH